MSPIPRSREAQMLLNFAIFSPNTSSDPVATPRNPPFYSADRLTDMQSLLAALADLETAYEIEREQVEQWSGSEAMSSNSWRTWRIGTKPDVSRFRSSGRSSTAGPIPLSRSGLSWRDPLLQHQG